MKPTFEQVYAIVRRNGAVRRPATDAQCRYYASLIVRTGARFEVGQYARDTWSSRTTWQMSQMIASLEKNL